MKYLKQICFAILFIVVCAFCTCFAAYRALAQTDGVIVLTNGWSLLDDGVVLNEQPTEDISDYTFLCEEKGDVLVLSRKLSEI